MLRRWLAFSIGTQVFGAAEQDYSFTLSPFVAKHKVAKSRSGSALAADQRHSEDLRGGGAVRCLNIRRCGGGKGLDIERDMGAKVPWQRRHVHVLPDREKHQAAVQHQGVFPFAGARRA